jgi:arylsulfatase
MRRRDGSRKAFLRRRVAHTEGWRPCIDMGHDICYNPLVHGNALTDGHVKYIFHAHDGSEQMVDLDNDPQEMHDVAASVAHQDQLNLWRALAVKHLEVRGDQWVIDGKLMVWRESMPISPNYPREEASRARRAPVRHRPGRPAAAWAAAAT